MLARRRGRQPTPRPPIWTSDKAGPATPTGATSAPPSANPAIYAKMPKLILYLVTYDSGLHPFTGQVKPYHWAYFLETASHNLGAPGIIFQLRGMPGGFHYPEPESLVVSQEGGPGELKDKLEVGEVEVVGGNDNDVQEAIAGIHEALREVEIVMDESVAWNCQDRSLRRFERLKQRGMVYEYLAPDSVRAWLKER